MMNFMSGIGSISTLVLLLNSFQPIDLVAQSRPEFAEFLFNQKDYFRAITVFKQLLFQSKHQTDIYSYSTKIAEGYRLSGRYKSSIYYYSEALRNANSPSRKSHALIGLGLNYYHLKVIPMAKRHFDQASRDDESLRAKLFMGLMAMENNEWEKAKEALSVAASASNNPEVAKAASFLEDKVSVGSTLPRKSPLAAAVLSAIVPGSGQIYAGHYFDGIQAFAYVGAFSLATYSAYRYDRDIKDSDGILFLSAAVTVVFYAANVLGAHQTVKFRNMRIRQDFLTRVRSLVFEIPF